VTALPEVYGLPKGGPERREVPAQSCPRSRGLGWRLRRPRSWSPREVGRPHCEARRAIGAEVARMEYLTRGGVSRQTRITG